MRIPVINFVKTAARKMGVNIMRTDRIGVDMELDLARLTAFSPLRTIFDVGGNTGQTALRLASAFPTARIFSFEPVPQTFDKLSQAVKHREGIAAVNSALGEKPGSVFINLTDNSQTATILATSSASNSVSIPVETIDRFAKTNGIETIDLLKIDVEGYEMQVLKGAEKLFHEASVRYVFAECVLKVDAVSPHTTFFELDKYLNEHGFCFFNYYAESFRLRDGCALGNVLYALHSKLPRVVAESKVANLI